MKLKLDQRIWEKPEATVRYVEEDFSINSENIAGDAYFTLMIRDLSIDFNELGYFTSIWGFCPRNSWKASVVNQPRFDDCLVSLSSTMGLKKNVGWPLVNFRDSDVVFDVKSGWLRIQDAQHEATRFGSPSPNVVFGVTPGGELCEVYLHPKLV